MPSSGGIPFKVEEFGALGACKDGSGSDAEMEGNGRRHC